jgi:hypothetical protein
VRPSNAWWTAAALALLLFGALVAVACEGIPEVEYVDAAGVDAGTSEAGGEADSVDAGQVEGGGDDASMGDSAAGCPDATPAGVTTCCNYQPCIARPQQGCNCQDCLDKACAAGSFCCVDNQGDLMCVAKLKDCK